MRQATVKRKTKETDITLSLNLDGGDYDIQTGIGFFDHMLTAFAVHGGFGLHVSVSGDLNVDCHHTIEDTGIVLGKAFSEALGDKTGITRYGSFYLPMDESLAFVSVDISGRPFLVFNAEFPQEKVGEYDSCMTQEFFRAFSTNAFITLHAQVLYGINSHHEIEALFKALAHALQIAVTPTNCKVMSTKGVL